MAGVWNWIEFFLFGSYGNSFLSDYFCGWIKTMFVQTNELYQLASVAICLLVAWVCSLPYFSHFCIFLWNALCFICSYKQKRYTNVVLLMCFTLFSEGLSSNLLVCVRAHFLCFVFLEFMFKRPFVPFIWHELCIFVSYDCLRIVYMCSVAWLPCCYLSSTTFLADCTYIFSV